MTPPPGSFSPTAVLNARLRRIARQRVLIRQALQKLDLLIDEGLAKRSELAPGRFFYKRAIGSRDRCAF